MKTEFIEQSVFELLFRWMIDGQYYNGSQTYHKGSYSSSYRIVVSKEKTVVKCEARNPYGASVGLGVVRLKPSKFDFTETRMVFV